MTTAGPPAPDLSAAPVSDPAIGATTSADPAAARQWVLPGWRRNQLGMVLVVFLAFLGFNFVQPILPLYVQFLGVRDVSAAALWAGAMLAVSPLIAAVCAPLWGMVADRYGRKRMVQRSLLAFVVANGLMALVRTVEQLFLLRTFVGLFGGFTAMATAYLVTVTPRERTGEAFGLLQAAQVAGLVVGPAVAGLLADHSGLRAPYWAAAGLILAGLAVMTLVTRDDRELDQMISRAERDRSDDSGAATSQRTSLWALARHPVMPLVMVVLLVSQFVDRSFGPILPLYVAALGTPSQTVASLSGLTISLGAIATALSAMAAGRFVGRRAPHRLLLPMLAAGVALSFPMALVQSAGQLLIARMLLGLFAGGTLTLGYALANQIIPAERKGTAFGAISSATLMGNAASPLVTGWLARFTLRSVFVLDSALFALALAWTWWSLRRGRVGSQ